MKIGVICSFVTCAALVGATAQADSKPRDTRAVERETVTATPSPMGAPAAVDAGKAARFATDRRESADVVERLQRTYGQASWYENASDAELASAADDAGALLSHLSALSVAMGEGAIANTASVVDGIRESVAGETQCRSDQKCMADRAAKRTEAAFVLTVVEPLCEADTILENARSEISREPSAAGHAVQDVARADEEAIQNARKTIKELNADFVKVRHHPFNGWRADCK